MLFRSVAAAAVGIVALATVGYMAGQQLAGREAAAPASTAAPVAIPAVGATTETVAQPAASAAGMPMIDEAPAPSDAAATATAPPPPIATAPGPDPAPPARPKREPRHAATAEAAPGIDKPNPANAAVTRSRCSDILQKASLEPLTSAEATFLKRECR